jgi:hypothetical protein
MEENSLDHSPTSTITVTTKYVKPQKVTKVCMIE